MNVGFVFTTRRILQREPSLQRVVESLSRLNRDSALEQCAKWNREDFLIRLHRFTWQNALEEFNQFLAEAIPAHLHKVARSTVNEVGFISPFTEIGILTTIGMASRFGKPVGGLTQADGSARWMLFSALLHLQTAHVPQGLLDRHLKEQFPHIMRTILANLSAQNTWGYDMGRLHAIVTVPEVGTDLRVARKGMTVEDWFQKRLGVASADYELMTNMQFGASFAGADFNLLPTAAPELIPHLLPLCDLASQTPEALSQSVQKVDDLASAMKYAEMLMVRPLVKVGTRHLVSSPAQLFNKFHRGLPYLATEIAGRNGKGNPTAFRDEFGYILQGYVLWLIRQWFAQGEAVIVAPYWARGDGDLHGRKDEPCEKDILLIKQETAFAIEIKASVPALAMRQTCEVTDFVKWLRPGTKQVLHAAHALVKGEAYYDAEMTKRIHPPKRVYPIGTTFEFNPLRYPYTEFFERQMEFGLPKSPFRRQGPVAPLQYLDIEQIEVWDDLFELPSGAGSLLALLARRAEDARQRYLPLTRLSDLREDYSVRPGLVRGLVRHAEEYTGSRLKALNRPTCQTEPRA